jgi:hypothetical protein
MFKQKPSIVKELRDGRVSPNLDVRTDSAIRSGGIGDFSNQESGSGQGRGLRWLLKDGRWRRPYGVLTAFCTITAGLLALESETRSPLDRWGREHCFTWLYYVRESALDYILDTTPTPQIEEPKD